MTDKTDGQTLKYMECMSDIIRHDRSNPFSVKGYTGTIDRVYKKYVAGGLAINMYRVENSI